MVRSWYRPGAPPQINYYVPERFVRKSARKPSSEAKIPASDIPNRLSCEAATMIVISYAFSDVRPMSCQGESYQFQAMRENNAYSIVLKAKDGELIQVKKVAALKRRSN